MGGGENWKDTLAGVAGATACVYAGQPFDTVKVRMQTKAGEYRHPVDCMIKTIRKEGVRALYKGSTPALAGSVAENAVLFTVNSFCKDFIEWFRAPEDRGKPFQEIHYACAGGVSGLFSGTALTPMEMVKCRLQVQNSGQGTGGVLYKGPVDCVVQSLKADGPAGLFRGWSSMVLRDIPFNFIFFGSYETMRIWIGRASSTPENTVTPDSLGPLALLLSGGIAGGCAWGAMYPVDVAKARIQTNPEYSRMSPVSALQHIVRTTGVRSLYKGWSAAVLRAFPANAALFAGYEMTRRALGHDVQLSYEDVE